MRTRRDRSCVLTIEPFAAIRQRAHILVVWPAVIADINGAVGLSKLAPIIETGVAFHEIVHIVEFDFCGVGQWYKLVNRLLECAAFQPVI